MRKAMTVVLFCGAAVATAGFYAVLMTWARGGPVYSFFCGRGWYQHASVLFLIYGLLLAGARYRALRREARSLQMPVYSKPLTPQEAAILAEKIPPEHRQSLLGRRLANLLRGYSRREDVGPLLDRLAEHDQQELERAGSLVAWVRSLPPVFGLLGTLDGLRGGIAKISGVSNTQDLEALRQTLQAFASHSSTAFDATLLGISAGMLLSVGIFVLGRSQEELSGKVDEIAHQLARRFIHKPAAEEELQAGTQGFLKTLDKTLSAAAAQILATFRAEMREGVSGVVRGWLESWKEELSQATRCVLDQLSERGGASSETQEALVRNGKAAVARLEAIERALTHPPPFQIKVSADSGANGRHGVAYESPSN